MRVNMQGIELEGYVISNRHSPFSFDQSLHRVATEAFGQIYEKYYYDDQKPEFPSEPCRSLGDLSDHISDVISQAVDVSKNNNWKYFLIGCFPFFGTFASGHIHSSWKGKDIDLDKTWLEMRKKLFNAQPMLALLSANSPIMNGAYRASDVRLLYSSWSRFTDFYDTSPNHWMSLARGEGGQTLEVRIPSSAPLHQIIGIAAFIRLILEDEDVTVPVLNIKEAYDSVVKYGSQTVVPVGLPKTVAYQGMKLKKVYVSMVDLWKLYYHENIDLFREALDSCPPKIQEGVFQFYDSIASGQTVSDRILAIWNSLPIKKDISQALSELTEDSYRMNPFIEKMPELEKVPIPQLPPKIDIEEFKEIVENVEVNEITLLEDAPDFLSCITGADGIARDSGVRRMIRHLVTHEEYLASGRNALINKMIDLKILKRGSHLTHRSLKRGERFPILIQFLQECDLI